VEVTNPRLLALLETTADLPSQASDAKTQEGVGGGGEVEQDHRCPEEAFVLIVQLGVIRGSSHPVPLSTHLLASRIVEDCSRVPPGDEGAWRQL